MKKKLRRIITLAIALVMLTGLAACGTTNQPPPSSGNPSATNAPTATNAPSASGTSDPAASGWTVEEMQGFYKGKTINMSVNEAPGANGDLMARMLLPYIQNYTSGNVVATNRREAAGVEAINWVYGRPEPDGLEIGQAMLANFLLSYIMELPGCEYNPAEIDFLFGVSIVPFVLVVNEDGPYGSIQDLQAASNLKFGSTGASSGSTMCVVSTIHLLGLDAKTVTGFNMGDLYLAILSGEVAAATIPIESAAVWEGCKMLFILSSERHPDAPDVPALPELMQIPADKKDLFDLWNDMLMQLHAYYTSPGTDPDKLEFLRGVADVLASPDGEQFRKDAAVLQGISVSPEDIIPGAELQKIVNDITAQAPKINGLLADLLVKYRA